MESEGRGRDGVMEGGGIDGGGREWWTEGEVESEGGGRDGGLEGGME